MQQTASRDRGVETIRLRNGRKAVTRRWDAAKGEWTFTRLGNRFYKTIRRNYVVQVPAIVRGTRANKSTYTHKAHLSVESLGLRPVTLPLNLTSPQRHARVRDIIEEQLPDDGVLYQVSEEVWSLDDAGSWVVAEETVGTDPDTGRAAAHVVMDRRVGAHPVPPATMLFPEAVCETAFEQHDDNLCAPRQIAALLKRDLHEICDELRAVELRLHGTDTLEEGCTSRVILEWCREHGLGAAVVHNEQVLEILPGKPVLTWTVHESHCWFYQTPQVRRALQHRRTGPVAMLRKAQGPSNAPLASEWRPWKGEIAEGHFYAPEEELPTIRGWFLSFGKPVKVLLKDACRPRALVYQLRQRVDEATGSCTIHGVPQHWEEIQAWCDRLALEYRGEGLPSMALKALDPCREEYLRHRRAEIVKEMNK
jgi:hypothetical protein